MDKLEMVIGLEVHCQLATATKLFCPCPTASFGTVANTFVCPVCAGHPGVLPVLNQRAVELAFTAALALDCRLREKSIFARKNYFYPDLPKGYQISQYEEPFSERGHLKIPGPPLKRVGIHRIHMEEDAGKLLHEIGSEELKGSLVDFNRAGVPLIEIVSEPELQSPEEAHQYLTQLKAILQYCGVSRCDMEKGEMRCDANISVRPRGSKELGTKVEIKNLNSFKAVKDALDHEFHRQSELLTGGGRVAQETRLWDVKRQATKTMRSKEEAHDYRYFPEPDLVPLMSERALVEKVRSSLPELPSARKARFEAEYKLSEYDAGVLTSEKSLADYFEAVVNSARPDLAKAVANWVQSEFMARLNSEGLPVEKAPIPPANLAELTILIHRGRISGKIAKEVFAKMWETGKNPGELVSELGLTQVSDMPQLKEWVEAAITENQRAASDFRAGNERAIGAIVGSVMKKSKGKANPALVNQLIKEKLA